MSILSDEIDNRYPLPEAGADTMVSMSRVQAEMLQRKAYAAGALRQFTEAEVESAAKTCFETYWRLLYGRDDMTWENDSSVASTELFTIIARTTLDTARAKTTEES